jgi:ribosome-binding ATPase
VKVGIVGLPNAGKSSLFRALTGVAVDTASYPFTTIEPNVAVVPVADDRLDAVARTIRAAEVVPDTISFHDIAGLVAGAHRGEGLGNQFLSNIRETDAIVHVVRTHDDPHVVHPDGRIDPVAGGSSVLRRPPRAETVRRSSSRGGCRSWSPRSRPAVLHGPYPCPPTALTS